MRFFNDRVFESRATFEEAQENLKELRDKGFYVIGTDEAGRGALAGPVMAAAVFLTPDQELELKKFKLRDSKKMTPKSREKLFKIMQEMKIKFHIAHAGIKKIERENILNASLYVMRRSSELLARDLENNFKISREKICVIVDGNIGINNFNFHQWPLIQADNLLSVVSAASVVAKVMRDRLMKRLSKYYLKYDLAQNKGYPTKKHCEVLADLGLSKIHRKSFCKKILKRAGGENFAGNK